MTQASIDGPKLKLERAKQHLRDFAEANKRFFDSNPYEIVIEDNPEADRREHRVIRAEAPPVELPLRAGDAIHNARSALDHLIWQLVIANNGQPDELTTEFPIWRSEAKFKAGRPGKAYGIGKEALDILYGLQPYKGGNNSLWLLHKLDIVDKHRLLLAVASAEQSVVIDFGARMRELSGNPEVPDMPIAINPPEREIVSVGSVVFGQPLGDDAHDDVKLMFAIALDEVEVPPGEPVAVTVGQIIDYVEEVIDLFAPCID